MDNRINHPNHYKLPNGIEAIDIARYLDFNCGNVLKYIVRAGRKTETGMTDEEKRLEDLQKAKVYLEDEIKMIEERRNNQDLEF